MEFTTFCVRPSVSRYRNSIVFKAVNFLTGIDNVVINPIFGLLDSRAIQNIWQVFSVSELIAVKLFKIAKSGSYLALGPT